MIHNLLAQLDTPSQNILLTAISVLWGSLAGAVGIMWRYFVRELRACHKDRREKEQQLWEILGTHGIRKPGDLDEEEQ